jgi:hypothetical protein
MQNGTFSLHVASCSDKNLLADASVSTILLLCDNRSVALHGNDPHSPLKDGQKQADLVRLLKSYYPAITTYCSIDNGSTSKATPTITNPTHKSISPLQQLNVRCDRLAKETLHHCITTNSYMTPVFPDEEIVIAVGSTKVRSSVKSNG